MRVACVVAAAVAAFAGYGWFELGAVMVPDFALYTQGGLGLFPSPVGRALGALGPDVFAWLSVAGAGASVLAAALTARARGGAPAVAAVAMLPGALWLGYAGIDPIALALLGFGYASSRPWLVGLAAGAHLSLVPFALLELGRRSTWPARFALGFVCLCAGIALALTPYQAVLWLWMDSEAVAVAGAALAAGLALSLPGLLLSRPTGLWVFALAVGVLESALQLHVQARYLLPAALLSGAGAARSFLPALFAGRPSRLVVVAPWSSSSRRNSYKARRLCAEALALSPRGGGRPSTPSPPVPELLQATPAGSVLPHQDTYAMPKMTKGPLDTAPSKITPTRLTRADARYRL